ncbi:hypothetical protein EX30DRAFT_36041 [Ascodesmis nigricans]|uniref:Uncharacterized protein n=1 Tax=Ascodesmis nigricans TaxID=341454 RepID=A0A4S2MWV8_9PEZI|nr:hypothetical protein EX30DRAFT_36041 [Ascodesmis nigricans]
MGTQAVVRGRTRCHHLVLVLLQQLPPSASPSSLVHHFCVQSSNLRIGPFSPLLRHTPVLPIRSVGCGNTRHCFGLLISSYTASPDFSCVGWSFEQLFDLRVVCF